MLRLIAEQAAQHHPYPLSKDILPWFAEHTAIARQRLAATMAHTLHLSVEEAVIRARGCALPKDHYDGCLRVARVPSGL